MTNADRPAAQGREQRDGSVGRESDVVRPLPGEASVPEHTIEPTRISMVWTMLGVGLLLLIVILVFILQNSHSVRVRFFMVDGSMPLGVGLLFAAILGALLVLVVGAARVVQLRVVARRHRRADRAA